MGKIWKLSREHVLVEGTLRHELEERGRDEANDLKLGPNAMRRLLADDDTRKQGVLGVRHLFAVYTDEDDGCEYLVVKARLTGEYLDHLSQQDPGGNDITVNATMLEEQERDVFKYRLEHTVNGLTPRPANWYTEEAAPLGADVYFSSTEELVQFYTEVPFFIERREATAGSERHNLYCNRQAGCLCGAELDGYPNATIFYMYLDKRTLLAVPWWVPNTYQLRMFASYTVLRYVILGMLALSISLIWVSISRIVQACLLGIFVKLMFEVWPIFKATYWS